MEAIKYWLHGESRFPDVQCNFILDSVNFLLHTNYFLFDGHFFLQQCGAAMGASFAPTYANLYMGWFEQLHIFQAPDHFRGRLVKFFRYIDDCIGIWDGDEESLEEFVRYCNGRVQGLAFTMETHKLHIPFLDVLFSVERDAVVTDLYRKPITRNTLLHSDSAHPLSCKKGIPVGQFIRLRRICSSWERFNVQAMQLWDRFLERGYENEVIREAYEKAVSLDRKALLARDKDRRRGTSRKDSTLRYCTTFDRSTRLIRTSVSKYWNVLRQDPILAAVLDPHPSFVFKRNRNLASWLSKSLYDSRRGGNNKTWLRYKGNYRCGRIRCKSCHYLLVSKEFRSTSTGRTYGIRRYFNCASIGVVYLVTCSCGAQYVGKTVRRAGTRILEHLSSVNRKDTKSAVAKHILDKHNGEIKIHYQVIDTVTVGPRGGNLDKLLLRKEAYWIYQLRSTESFGGLNREWEVSCFY
ncbi:uncharacterized protein LOC121397896 [Xenopus laevis]|uniref:Uncharacterized protein LOC121397896 n=1 Tax=Xenopus laevis TaxID=8355 RepID=A0A8J1LQU2_XENLA|nr:uncharacterized protein LOC121397896 [Xenopus laevis]